jgi:hypothetical protein
MISPSVSTRTLRLHTEVFFWRQGYVWALVLILMMVACGMFLGERYLLQPKQRLLAQTAEKLQSSLLAQQQARDSTNQHTPLDPSLAAQASLRSVMVDRDALGNIIRSLHAAAHRHGIELDSSDYQQKGQGRGEFVQQTVTLPMRVGYARFKPFLMDVLRTNPGISVDQISIKREAVSQGDPDIVLRLSVWVATQPGTKMDANP